ncbi:DUF624 domain-containing protein [Heyndrickxia ginsengihumi]|uniref:DUF624 domain-containing protein n=1 Tax=Heyndrickxia ginsengihumi TaxID=363870 RepID=UPI0004702F8E|nr:DUF624 domain-containing protein [Heyndrickxia ginsengihumi]MBE6185569.1 DUF624 domain-containing protein [Bacillus sp. (in: firmicutes)]
MNWINSKFYGDLLIFTNYILLSLLWIICCLPVMTIFAATTSMFSVVKNWRNGGDERILSEFFGAMKKSIFQKILINFIFILFFIVVYEDLTLMTSIQSSLLFLGISFILLSTLLMFSVLVHIFNIYIQFEKISIVILFKNALLISAAQFKWTIAGIAFLLLCAITVYVLPFLLFIIGSFVAFVLISISERSLNNMGLKESGGVIEKYNSY